MKPYLALAAYLEDVGLSVSVRSSTRSASKYVHIECPVTGEVETVRFANHAQSGLAMALHGVAIDVGRYDGADCAGWKQAAKIVIKKINGSREKYGDALIVER